MTREKAREILGTGASEEQVTKMINDFHEETKTYEDKINALTNENETYKSQLGDTQTKLASSQSELNKIKTANMTDQELIAQQKKEAEEILRKAKIELNSAQVRTILAGESLDDATLNDIVSDDMELSLRRANALKNALNSAREVTEKKVRGELASVPVEPKLSNVPQGQDNVDINKFLSMSAKDQEKFINEHPQEYANF